MFGNACDETQELMPAPLVLAYRLVQRQAELRKSCMLPRLRLGAMPQVTFRYGDGQPIGVQAVVVSAQHASDIGNDTLLRKVSRHLIDAAIP